MSTPMKEDHQKIVIVLFAISFVFGAVFLIPAVILMWIRTNWRKWVKVVLTILSIGFFLVITALSLFISLYLFGYRPFEVKGNNMSPDHTNGEYVLVKVVNRERINGKINVGDVITYEIREPIVNISRVRSLSQNEKGIDGVTVSQDAYPNKTSVVPVSKIIGVVKMCYWNCK